MRLETIEIQNQTVIVHLHATSSSALCPRCGTPGSRVHSHYQRTIADVAFGERCLVLKLRVRKWICHEASCPQHIFAERFPELVQRYARMTDRLVKALQTLGVTTNGTDAARIASSLGMPTTAKTIIRRVLQLPLPRENKVAKVGIDEWAWKKGQRYGTILVDLEKRRVVQLLAERSVETSKAWLRTHPEIDLVSRDRGKIFREAAAEGAPQAQQVVDRFHLQKNFAEALEKFFRKQERVLKKATQRHTGKTRSAARTTVPEKIAQERRTRHRQRVHLHKRIWKLYRQGYHKEQIAQLVGVSSSRVYRALAQETPPSPRRRARSSSIVDPYLSYLTVRWNQGCHNVARLYDEIVAASDIRVRSGRFSCGFVPFVRMSYVLSPKRWSSGTNPSGLTRYYQTRFWARVHLEPFHPQFETRRRTLATPKDFLSLLSWEHTKIAQALFDIAIEQERFFSSALSQ